jgi:lipoprotein-anchoring transpeptidase ErfK/SrfK
VNSLKTVIVVAVMAVVAYGVFATLTQGPTEAPTAATAPSTVASPAADTAPTFVASQPAGAAAPGEHAATGHDHDHPEAVKVEAGHASEGLPDALAESADKARASAGETAAAGHAPADPNAGYAVAQDSDLAAAPVRPASASPADLGALPGGPSEFAVARSRIEAELSAGRLANALRDLTLWYDDPRLTPIEQADVLVLLDQLAGSVVYSRQHLMAAALVAGPGETVEQIAATHHVPWQLLAKVNGLSDPGALRPGQSLKIIPGPFAAVIDLEKFRLTLFVDGCYAGRFLIGVGSGPSTPLGQFTVREKIENPEYTAADGRTIAANDSSNPLGELWIGLGDRVGIHGTNNPQAIGGRSQHGSIAMGPEDIKHVYDILSAGSTVVIRQ